MIYDCELFFGLGIATISLIKPTFEHTIIDIDYQLKDPNRRQILYRFLNQRN